MGRTGGMMTRPPRIVGTDLMNKSLDLTGSIKIGDMQTIDHDF